MAFERNAGFLVPRHIKSNRKWPRHAARDGLSGDRNVPPAFATFQSTAVLHMQGLQHLRILQGQLR